ncbi:T9SS type A sorting domain-containing protein [Flavobacterium sp.]|uniref:T9SS type A sorting domain-containing protein n=1 Tax=Flavobacterium sp. TaxID=239 RepID=UPI003529B5D7
MKQIYFLTVLTIFTLTFSNAQTPTEDGTVIATENFDAVTPPTPASDYFTFDAVLGFGVTFTDFKNTIDFTATADVNGTGQGVAFYYDANLFNDEEITLHTFTNVAPGDYIIQYDINNNATQFSYEALISDGTNYKTQGIEVFSSGVFSKRYTPQISITTTSDLSFTMYMSPFGVGYTSSTVYIDNVELIKMNGPLPTTVSGSTMVEEENFDTASTVPASTGPTSFTNNISLSSNADVNGTGQGLQFNYIGYYLDQICTIDMVTFSSVPAGSYYIEYQFDEGNTNANVDFTYYNQITDGTSSLNNYIISPVTTGFTTHRTQSITTTSTGDITFKWIGSQPGNNVTNGTPVYIDNVRLMTDPTLSLNDIAEQEEKISIYPNPAFNYIQINGLKQKQSFSIYNVIGKKINTGHLTDNEKIDISQLTNGLYFLKFNNGITLKFIKQ